MTTFRMTFAAGALTLAAATSFAQTPAAATKPAPAASTAAAPQAVGAKTPDAHKKHHRRQPAPKPAGSAASAAGK
jgi:hypothetical protein